MSVRTTADELLYDAAELLKQASQKLSQFLTDDCWGVDDYTPEYRQKVLEVFNSVISAKIILNKG